MSNGKRRSRSTRRSLSLSPSLTRPVRINLRTFTSVVTLQARYVFALRTALRNEWCRYQSHLCDGIALHIALWHTVIVHRHRSTSPTATITAHYWVWGVALQCDYNALADAPVKGRDRHTQGRGTLKTHTENDTKIPLHYWRITFTDTHS